jgi:hypothetical protein
VGVTDDAPEIDAPSRTPKPGRRLREMKAVLNRALAVTFARSVPVQVVDMIALGLRPDRCVWCGEAATCSDHLWGLTVDGRWSGHPEVLVPACDPCNEQRPSRDPLTSIDSNPRVRDKAAARERVLAVLATTKTLGDLPPEAAQEQDAIYAAYAELWQQVRELDARAGEWGARWGPSLSGDRA